MKLLIVVLTAVSACSAEKAPPMSGKCVDREAPNLFDQGKTVSFRQCKWEGRTWACMLTADEDAWQCKAVTVAP